MVGFFFWALWRFVDSRTLDWHWSSAQYLIVHHSATSGSAEIGSCRLSAPGCTVLYCTVLYCAGCQHRAILRISAARQLMNMCTQITFKSNAKRIQIHSDSFIRLRGKMGGSGALENTRKYSAYCAFCALNSTIVSNFCSPPPLAAVASPLQTSHAVNNIP